MREISQQELFLAFGAGESDPNTQLLKDMGTNMAWGATLGAPGGLGTAALGAAGGAIQTVGQGLIDHGPVNVPVPVLINPNWNSKAGRECYWSPNNLNDVCY
ncbi:microcin [Salmonella enterica subsp. enterica serovar Urbana]|nr:microcin [Salmonella enterica subsp. enterica serovar Urbana]